MNEPPTEQSKINPENERIKRKYFQYAKEAGQKSQMTIDNHAKSILRFETSSQFRDFCRFQKQDAVDFKEYLAGLRNRKGELLSKSTWSQGQALTIDLSHLALRQLH